VFHTSSDHKSSYAMFLCLCSLIKRMQNVWIASHKYCNSFKWSIRPCHGSGG
jgi:hypothetical protein